MIRRRRHTRIRKTPAQKPGLVTANIILLSLLVAGFSKVHNDQVISRYRADFGFYGQSISLMDDFTFAHHYAGCSQAYGTVRGSYRVSNDTLYMSADKKAEAPFTDRYLIRNDSLIGLSQGINYEYCLTAGSAPPLKKSPQ
ncbi:hypothetical protein AB9P05_04495 [Roseivirga sp. BDSF3-8]|uniref:hypothetical protein n=1 Tax=Roseivirga sp. BDSF3-8 TaxID=3241598 RepID=UPI00353262F9